MNQQDKLLEELKAISKRIMEQDHGFHDYAHIASVYDNVRQLLKYKKADELVLLTAALFHDIRRGEKDHGILAANDVKDILIKIKNFPKNKIDDVSRLIMSHNKVPVSDDEKILYDADKMDALSDLGLLRSFMMYSKEGFSLKDSCADYVKFVNKIYNTLYLPESKKIIKKRYVNTKKMIVEILCLYDADYVDDSSIDAHKL